MAAKTTKRARELDERGRAAAKRAFLFDELDPAEIAKQLNVAAAYVQRLADAERWLEEAFALGRCREYMDARDRQTTKIAKAKAQIEVLHAESSVMRARAQRAVARGLAEEAAQAKTVKELHSVARALGPASQDVTSGRLAVGLSTSKDDVADEAVDEFCRAWVQAVAEGVGVASPDGSPRDPAGVEQTTAPGAAPVAGKA